MAAAVLLPPSGRSHGHVCIVTHTLPWMFGPYQTQGLILSRQLAKIGHKTLWMPKAYQLPEKEYSGTAAPSKLAKRLKIEGPRSNFDGSHLSYVGLGTKEPHLRISTLNRLAIRYKIDAYILLMDLGSVMRDKNFSVKAICWFPHHFMELNSQDRFTLQGFSAVASLAPSSAKALRNDLAPGFQVEFIPHVIEPVPVPPGETKAKVRRVSGVPDGAFVVLLQGGNYEPYNRKGWDTSILAFKEFKCKVPSAHLYIHAIKSGNIVAQERGTAVSAMMKTSGIDLRSVIYAAQLPSGCYTLDDEIHPLAEAHALKRMSDVLLHPSKAEGFGMNILEAQIIGIPVITTDFMAMGDFTKYGIAVSPLQLTYMSNGFAAMPNVAGIVDALMLIHDGKLKDTKLATQKWIKQDFSPDLVGVKFSAMIKKCSVPKPFPMNPQSLYTLITAEHPRYLNWTTPFTLLANPDVVFNHAMIQRLLLSVAEDADAIVIHVQEPNGTVLPLNKDGMVNPDLAVLVRTCIFASTQQLVGSHRYRIIATVLTTVKDPKQMPPGLAKIEPALRQN